MDKSTLQQIRLHTQIYDVMMFIGNWWVNAVFYLVL